MTSDIHPLRRYLFEHGETLKTFGLRAGMAPGYLSELMNAKKRPSLNAVDKIMVATNGAITASDFPRVKGATNP